MVMLSSLKWFPQYKSFSKLYTYLSLMVLATSGICSFVFSPQVSSSHLCPPLPSAPSSSYSPLTSSASSPSIAPSPPPFPSFPTLTRYWPSTWICYQILSINCQLTHLPFFVRARKNLLLSIEFRITRKRRPFSMTGLIRDTVLCVLWLWIFFMEFNFQRNVLIISKQQPNSRK